MKQAVIEKQFKKLIPYWAKRLGLNKQIILTRDNRMWFWAYVNIYYGRYSITLNFKEMEKNNITKREIIHLIFHELGHLKKKALWRYMGQIKSEYIAEKTALKWMKKYYPKYYKIHVNRMKLALSNQYYQKEKPYYRKAFLKIKEYQIK